MAIGGTTRGSFDGVASIPVIDLAGYLSGCPGALEETALEIRLALEKVGFFVIVNHEVPAELIEATFEQARRFHAQSLDWKMALRMNEHSNGYMAMNRYVIRTSEVNENDKYDLNEAFFVRRERSLDHPGVAAGRRFSGLNIWPANFPGFRDATLTYFDALDELTSRLLRAVAMSLSLAPDYFDRAFIDNQSVFRMSHYPPVTAAKNQYGIAPHTDANFMTFVAQTPVAGLEVQMPNGKWLPVPYIANSFAVNSGDMLYRWSNGRFKSTAHRVVPPEGVDRYAIPFFLGPHLDAVIECLPTCADQGRPARFEPITYEKYLNWWYDSNYDARDQADD